MTNPATPSPAPAKGGMPKWLIILLVILLLVVLGCCGGFAACGWACNKAANSVSSALPSLGNLATQKLTEAATQKLAEQGMAIDTTGKGLGLPANFPKDIPLAKGFKIVQSVAPPGDKGSLIVLTGTDTPSTLAAFYDSEMSKQGWTQVNAVNETDSFERGYTKDKRIVTLEGSGKAGASTFQIFYGTQD